MSPNFSRPAAVPPFRSRQAKYSFFTLIVIALLAATQAFAAEPGAPPAKIMVLMCTTLIAPLTRAANNRQSLDGSLFGKFHCRSGVEFTALTRPRDFAMVHYVSCEDTN